MRYVATCTFILGLSFAAVADEVGHQSEEESYKAFCRTSAALGRSIESDEEAHQVTADMFAKLAEASMDPEAAVLKGLGFANMTREFFVNANEHMSPDVGMKFYYVMCARRASDQAFAMYSKHVSPYVARKCADADDDESIACIHNAIDEATELLSQSLKDQGYWPEDPDDDELESATAASESLYKEFKDSCDVKGGSWCIAADAAKGCLEEAADKCGVVAALLMTEILPHPHASTLGTFYFELSCELGSNESCSSESCSSIAAESCHNLSVIFHEGKIVERDQNSAIKWAEKSCKLDFPASCGHLSALLLDTKEYELALSYAKASCGVANGVGCNAAGLIYGLGLGRPADRSVAADYYRRSCKAGLDTGCDNLLAVSR